MKRLSLAILSVVLFTTIPIAQAVESTSCDLKKTEKRPGKPPKVIYHNETAACIIKEAVVLGNWCENMLEGGMCGAGKHSRFLQILHPTLGYMRCDIHHGFEFPDGTHVLCYKNGFTDPPDLYLQFNQP